MSDELESVLRRVADGDLTPEQALHLLDGTEPPAEPTLPVYGSADPTNSVNSADAVVDSVRLKSSYRSIQIQADPSVAQIHVSGPHSIQQQGSSLVVTTPGPLDDDDREPRPTGGKFSFADLPRTFAWARAWREHQLTVRVNPALAVYLDTTGSEVKVSGLEAELHAHLVASSFKADRIRGLLDVEAYSSSLKISSRPTGDSRFYCESSSARLTLLRDTDMVISASNRMGRLQLPDRPAGQLAFEGETAELTLGAGTGRLEVETVMSSVTVNAVVWEEVSS